ncbi:YbjN domain-containing protein [Georgenia yuyongxinii]|uniref:YbjN domain-containing protein n=1 Tax=Georgenia yuyongxinii TaxID=2589797 RepID=UPI00163DE1D9|nr:YbjN domain-containing protein [Georgenia yuyongxinii]
MTWAWWRRPRPAAAPPAGQPDQPGQRDPDAGGAAPPARDAGRRPPGPPTLRTSPVAAARLHDVIAARGYHVREEPDGSMSGLWDGYQFQVRLTGEEQDFLSVRGLWGRLVPPELRGAVAQAANDWNRDKIWPTIFTAETAEGLSVRTEIMADVGAGATDRQLLDIVEGGLSAGVQFFQALGRSMPPIEEPSPEI